MKKLICLIICIACVLTMLASCGDDTVCEAHADADKNGACDTCGVPVYTVVEKVPTEEEVVNMVVSAIPEGATLGTVWAFDDEGALTEFKKADKLEDLKNAPYDPTFLDGNMTLMAYYYITQTAGADTTEETWTDESDPFGFLDDDKYVDTYVVYNFVADVNVCTYTTGEYTLVEKDEDHVDWARTELVEDYFVSVEIRDWYYDEEETWWYSDSYVGYYLANGTKLFDERDFADKDNYDLPKDFAKDENYAYVTIGDVKYVYDLETYALVGQGDAAAFINRPAFSFETDAYGLVEMEGKIYVYDLTKWIECVYSYDIPARAETWFLANGNILVQERVVLPNSAVNYDYVDVGSGLKYDLVYTIVNVAEKTEKQVEFGYYIQSSRPVSDDDSCADAVKNILRVREIKNKNLDNPLVLYCDDALNILAEEDAVLPEFVIDAYAVADGVFYGTVVYGEGSSVNKLFDKNGAVLATLPNGARVYNTCVEHNGSYYDFTMKLLLDLDADEDDPYYLMAENDDFILLRKGEDYYYWNGTLAAPVMIAKATNVPAASDDPDADPVETPNPVIEQDLVNWYEQEYFIVKTTTTTESDVAGEDPTVEVEYKVYNADNKCILTTATEVNITTLGDCFVAMDDDGNVYVVR